MVGWLVGWLVEWFDGKGVVRAAAQTELAEDRASGAVSGKKKFGFGYAAGRAHELHGLNES